MDNTLFKLYHITSESATDTDYQKAESEDEIPFLSSTFKRLEVSEEYQKVKRIITNELDNSELPPSELDYSLHPDGKLTLLYSTDNAFNEIQKILQLANEIMEEENND